MCGALTPVDAALTYRRASYPHAIINKVFVQQISTIIMNMMMMIEPQTSTCECWKRINKKKKKEKTKRPATIDVDVAPIVSANDFLPHVWINIMSTFIFAMSSPIGEYRFANGPRHLQ